MVWQKSYHGNAFDGFEQLQVTSDGMIIVAGYIDYWREFAGHFWILKLNGSGDTIWQKVGTVDQPLYERVEAIVETSDGGYIAAGGIDTGGQKDRDFLVLKLDHNGNIPGCPILRDSGVASKDISLTRFPLGTEHSDMAVSVDETFIEPIDTHRVAMNHCPDTYPLIPISSDFDIVDFEDGFTYYDDVFMNTHQPEYASGHWSLGMEGDDDGALHVSVGGVDGVHVIDGISGGWSKSFTLNHDSNAEITLSYSLETFQYDADECAEALVAMDGEVVYVLDKLCGRDQQTGWLTTSFHQFLSEGTHTLTVGAYNNKKTGPREKADVYFDEISIVINEPHLEEVECVDGIDNDGDGLTDCDDSDCGGSIECPSDPYLLESFDVDHDIFVYQNDLFYDTHQATYANGQWVEEGNADLGAMQLTLGNVDSKHILDGISGGWQGHFATENSSDVAISIDYRLVMSRFDTDECAQVLVQVDGEPVEEVTELCGRGKDTGWQTYTFSKSLLPGDHKLSIGGFLNQKTGQREKADIYFDNIAIR
jgi:hypothetical protein